MHLIRRTQTDRPSPQWPVACILAIHSLNRPSSHPHPHTSTTTARTLVRARATLNLALPALPVAHTLPRTLAFATPTRPFATRTPRHRPDTTPTNPTQPQMSAPGSGLGSSPNVPPPQGHQGHTHGGLASSPNVPRPGQTIDPNTGKPHTAGLTRAELEAKRAAEAEAKK